MFLTFWSIRFATCFASRFSSLLLRSLALSFAYLSISLFRLSLCPLYLSLSVCLCLSVCLSVCLCLSVGPSIHPSIHPSIDPSIYLSLSIHLSISSSRFSTMILQLTMIRSNTTVASRRKTICRKWIAHTPSVTHVCGRPWCPGCPTRSSSASLFLRLKCPDPL